MAKRGLGRGLEALLPEISPREGVQEVPLDEVRPNPYQPRRTFDEEKIRELAESIREHGVVQPVIVRRGGGGYELVAGERRWRAAREAGLATIPAVVRDFSEAELMQIALVENLQREDLNPIEEALAYKRLIEEFGLTQEQLARRLSRSRPQIANTLRLLNLSPTIQDWVAQGRLSAGHAKVLLGVEGPARERLARLAVDKGASVREIEELAAGHSKKEARAGHAARKAGGADPELRELEERMMSALGTRVTIHTGPRKGRIEIEFYGQEDLGRIAELVLGSRG